MLVTTADIGVVHCDVTDYSQNNIVGWMDDAVPKTRPYLDADLTPTRSFPGPVGEYST